MIGYKSSSVRLRRSRLDAPSFYLLFSLKLHNSRQKILQIYLSFSILYRLQILDSQSPIESRGFFILFLPCYNSIMTALAHLQIRNPKDDETPIEAATQIFASLLPSSNAWLKGLRGALPTYSFELYYLGQRIYFYVTGAKKNEEFLKSLVSSSFPSSLAVKTKDPLEYVLNSPFLAIGEMVMNSYFYLPVKTFQDFRDIDALSGVLGFLARGSVSQKAAIQILVSPATFAWQHQATHISQASVYDAQAEKYNPNSQKMLINRKSSFQGGKALIRLLTGADTEEMAVSYLQNLGGTFGAFSLGEGNQFKLKRPKFFKKNLLEKMQNRTTHFFEHRQQILNAAELATMWHPPGLLLAGD